MINSTLTSKRIRLAIGFAIALAVSATAQTQNPAERQHAIEVYESQNLVAALPLLEKVALAYPNDPVVLGGVILAMLVLGLVAAWIPAQKALGVNPVVLMREE